MRLGRCSATNFGSYSELSLDFSKSGLSLIYGQTGSGKSTIPDIPCWILYGTTAKGGSVDDIRSWQAGKLPTYGFLEVFIGNSNIWVTRIRGCQQENDLFWTEGNSEFQQRGKDITDTQKLLNERLGVSEELYLLSAYYNEFSLVGQFFTCKAKDRRALFDKIASLELPDRLASSCSKAKKEIQPEISISESLISRFTGSLEEIENSIKKNKEYSESWEIKKNQTIESLMVKFENFEEEQNIKFQILQSKCKKFEDEVSEFTNSALKDIQDLNDKTLAPKIYIAKLAELEYQAKSLNIEVCPTCKSPSPSEKTSKLLGSIYKIKEKQAANDVLISKKLFLEEQLKKSYNKTNPYEDQLAELDKSKNLYGELLEQEKNKTNPFVQVLENLMTDKESLQKKLEGCIVKKSELSHTHYSLDHLYDLCSELRGELLKKAVSAIEKSTNEKLEKYFDSEIRANFVLDASDSLEVSLYKGGYECNFKQLSKGQRRLLTLCFVTSMMEAASNKAGVHFDNIFMDEALDGLDSDLKLKAFSLLQTLENNHESLFVIDHDPGFQNLFSKRYHVSLVEDNSIVDLEE